MATATFTPAPPPSAGRSDESDHYEVVNGQRVEIPRMGSHESNLANDLAFFLNQFARLNQLGRAVVEVLFRIDMATNLQRKPDVAYVSYQRWPRGRKAAPKDAWNVVPDLAVEVVSDSNSANEIQAKIQDYFRCGVRLVWVIYPVQEQIYVYESPTRIDVRLKEHVLDAGQVIPGFQLPLAELFMAEDEPAGA
jgi:Uma2 family endonuclease